MTGKEYRKSIVTCLCGEPLDLVLAQVLQWPPRWAISPLIACLFHGDERVRWHAVSALGAVTELAETHPEAARTVVRRLMWSLNDESGSIGWGAPEALGEIVAVHGGFARNSAISWWPICVPTVATSNSPSCRGLMWGLGRLAGTRPDILRGWDASVYLQPYLDSEDQEVRGLAARALGLLKVKAAKKRIEALEEDPAKFLLYSKGVMIPVTVGSIARSALEDISCDP